MQNLIIYLKCNGLCRTLKTSVGEFIRFFLSNGYLCPNLACASTQQKISIFGKYSHSPKSPFLEICTTRQTLRHSPNRFARLARLADIHQSILGGLARLADIRQSILGWLARLAKGEFCKCYTNLASLSN
jgi:hypothetical protein